MPLSTNTLFHFTGSINVLFKILEKGFWPMYSKETGWGKEGEIRFAIPMVSFCNIPLSQIGEHIKYYGNYGIGISMSWVVMKKEIQPVTYTTNTTISEINAKLEDGLTEVDEAIWIRIKRYKGWNWKSKIDKKNLNSRYSYYDEREWRYIPEKLTKEQLLIPVNKEDDVKYLNSNTKGYCLTPPLRYINYIIIRYDTERAKVLEYLKEPSMLFGKKYSEEELSVLKSKIISCTQIKRDF